MNFRSNDDFSDRTKLGKVHVSNREFFNQFENVDETSSFEEAQFSVV